MVMLLPLNQVRDSQSAARIHGSGLAFAVAAALTLGCAFTAVSAQPSAGPITKAPQPAVEAGPRWAELSADQKHTLAPLEPSWDSLEAVRKRKWMALAQTYPKMTPVEQAKLQTRMAEWAALSPRQRAVARLNYSETKKVPASDRAANWDAYQALPPEDRQRLAAQAAKAHKGAALAPKHSTLDKVIPVPVTRRTPAQERANVSAVVPTIDSKTLLPQAPKPAKVAASAPGG